MGQNYWQLFTVIVVAASFSMTPAIALGPVPLACQKVQATFGEVKESDFVGARLNSLVKLKINEDNWRTDYGVAFLIDPDQSLFATAKHVIQKQNSLSSSIKITGASLAHPTSIIRFRKFDQMSGSDGVALLQAVKEGDDRETVADDRFASAIPYDLHFDADPPSRGFYPRVSIIDFDEITSKANSDAVHQPAIDGGGVGYDDGEKYTLSANVQRGDSGAPLIDEATGWVVGLVLRKTMDGNSAYVWKFNHDQTVKFLEDSIGLESVKRHFAALFKERSFYLAKQMVEPINCKKTCISNLSIHLGAKWLGKQKDMTLKQIKRIRCPVIKAANVRNMNRAEYWYRKHLSELERIPRIRDRFLSEGRSEVRRGQKLAQSGDAAGAKPLLESGLENLSVYTAVETIENPEKVYFATCLHDGEKRANRTYFSSTFYQLSGKIPKFFPKMNLNFLRCDQSVKDDRLSKVYRDMFNASEMLLKLTNKSKNPDLWDNINSNMGLYASLSTQLSESPLVRNQGKLALGRALANWGHYGQAQLVSASIDETSGKLQRAEANFDYYATLAAEAGQISCTADRVESQNGDQNCTAYVAGDFSDAARLTTTGERALRFQVLWGQSGVAWAAADDFGSDKLNSVHLNLPNFAGQLIN